MMLAVLRLQRSCFAGLENQISRCLWSYGAAVDMYTYKTAEGGGAGPSRPISCFRPSIRTRRRFSSWAVSEREPATALVIGGGLVGAGVAYQLAGRHGLKNVLLIETGRTASGSTRDAVGFVSSCCLNPRYKSIYAYSVDFYWELSKRHENVFEPTGTVRLATSVKRETDFLRFVSRDDFYGAGTAFEHPCSSRYVGPTDVERLLNGLVDVSDVRGALHTINDGICDPVRTARAMLEDAQKNGVQVIEDCRALSFTNTADGYWDVETNRGRIKALHVVNAAGLWAKDLARLVGVELPVVYLEQQYAQLSPVEELKDNKNLPVIIDHASSFTARPLGDKLVVTGYEFPGDITSLSHWARDQVPMPTDFSKELVARPETLKEVLEVGKRLLPMLSKETVKAEYLSSPLCATADGHPLLGPVCGLKNYWVATGFSDTVSSAPGFSKYLADWIVSGEPPFETYETDVERFQRWASWDFIESRAKETQSMRYNWHLPPERRLAGRPTYRVSGTYGALRREGAQMLFHAGWETPAYFPVDDEDEQTALVREYLLVTNKCGVVDMSFKAKFEVRGSDAADFLSLLLSVRPPELHGVTTGLMLTHSGRILSVPKVLHHDQHQSVYLLLSNIEHEARDKRWMTDLLNEKKMDVEVNVVSEYLASLAVIGRQSKNVLESLTKTDVSDSAFPHRTTKLLRCANIPVIAARSSVTGEIGYELFHNRADSLKLYGAIMNAGQRFGIVNFGMETLNTLRLEKGYRIFGKELSLDTNPFEAGLGMLVDSTKTDFIGKAAVDELSQKKFNRRLELVQFDATDNQTIPRGGEVLRKEANEQPCGQVSSGCYSVRLQRALCLAWLSNDVVASDMLNVDLDGVSHLRGYILNAPPAVSEDERWKRSPAGQEQAAAYG